MSLDIETNIVSMIEQQSMHTKIPFSSSLELKDTLMRIVMEKHCPQCNKIKSYIAPKREEHITRWNAPKILSTRSQYVVSCTNQDIIQKYVCVSCTHTLTYSIATKEDGYMFLFGTDPKYIASPSEYCFIPNAPEAAYVAYAAIFAEANLSINIIDPYFNHTSLTLFRDINKALSIKILSTTKGFKKNVIQFNHEIKQLRNKNIVIEIRKSTTDFHDRTIIIDDTKVLFSGGSIKDVGNKSPGYLTEVRTPKNREDLIATFNNAWGSAQSIEPSI